MSLQISTDSVRKSDGSTMGWVTVEGDSVWVDFRFGYVIGPATQEEAMCQARLFAAAADMLAALKTVMPYLMEGTSEHRRVSAAIAKAEGAL